MAVQLPVKRTNGRIFLGAGFRFLEGLSPELAGWAAFQLFATPVHRPSGWTHPPDRMSWLRWKGHHLATYVWEADGPTVLLVHGWAGRASDLGAVADSLRAAGHRVVAFDLPAHGASTGRRTTLPEGVQAVEAVAWSQPGLKAIVAHSFGGVLATLALTRGLNCERVVLLASPAEMEPYLLRLERGLGLRTAGQTAFRARIDRVLAAAGMPNVSLPTLVPALSQPALLLHDASDVEVPVSSARRLARAWPGAEFVELQGLGHRRLLQSPEVIARVRAFATGRSRQADRPVAVAALRAV